MLDPIGQELARRGIVVHSIPLSRRETLVGSLAFNMPRQFRWYEHVCIIVSNRLRGRFKPLGQWLGAKVWEVILRERDAGVVLAIQPHKQLCLAAKHLGVDVFDVQHGQINLENRYYGRLHRGAPLELLRSAPDGVLCWDDISTSGAASMLAIPAETIGHPSLALPLPTNPDESPLRSEMRALRTAEGRLNASKVIVAPDTWVSSFEEVAQREDFLTLLARLVDRHRDVLWIIRPHPVQMRGHQPGNDWLAANADYRRCFGDAQNVVDPRTAGESPLFEVLSEADGVLTMSSGVLIEASYLSVPVAIAGLSREVLEPFFDSRYLDGVEWVGASVEEVSRWIAGLPEPVEHRGSEPKRSHQARMQNWITRLEQRINDGT
jgi:hypothetical protein